MTTSIHNIFAKKVRSRKSCHNPDSPLDYLEMGYPEERAAKLSSQ